MAIPLWSPEEVQTWWSHSGHQAPNAYALYRSDWGAITTDPRSMMVPVDDHLVHRGDGVFETLLGEQGAIYNLQAHLTRLRSSAASIRLELPWTDSELRKILVETFRASEQTRALGRVLVGRGPGGFSVSPAESRGASLYVIVYPASAPFMEAHPQGARAITSQIPPKAGALSTIKTCNYIPNALMKQEALDRKVDFALGVDDRGFLTESATENVAAIPEEGVLQLPPAPHHLSGTTLARVAELMGEAGWELRREPLRADDLFEMKETLIVGTTAYVTQVVELEGKSLPTGPLASEWHRHLENDIRENAALRTVWNETAPESR